ncbi:MAG: DUF1801 domain-containing protein [Bacteroidetes bacterium]|nr:DUF1801 domain-containing protein [Bacteroidota bacterium]
MQIAAKTPEEYISKLPEDRKKAITKLRNEIKSNLPDGFEETMNYGMIGYVVPHSIYPKGYHCDPKQPLPFINIASQKNHIAVYHMGVYADKKLLDWFISEYAKQSKVKLDMGKSCIRFKKPEHITYDLIGKLASKMTSKEWIDNYEAAFKK